MTSEWDGGVQFISKSRFYLATMTRVRRGLIEALWGTLMGTCAVGFVVARLRDPCLIGHVRWRVCGVAEIAWHLGYGTFNIVEDEGSQEGDNEKSDEE
jgi:hypothetical protein